MERTATHDTEYVDIVLGYHHILLFSMVFGVLIFGTGFFIGYYRARTDQADRAAAAATSPRPSSRAPELPVVQIPAMLTQPPAPAAGDVVKEMEAVSTETLATQGVPKPAPPAAADAGQESVTAAPPPAPEAATAPPAAAGVKPEAADAPQAERQPPANGKAAPQPAEKTVPRAAAKPPNAGGNVYLQVSSFGAQQEAERLTNELAAEGFRALIDGQLMEGRHTVLVGPFADFKTAVGKAKELKEHNREAFPIRR